MYFPVLPEWQGRLTLYGLGVPLTKVRAKHYKVNNSNHIKN
jgi:hypothetical protein